MKFKKIYAIALIAAISVAIIVPVILLQSKAPVPLAISIISPTNTTYSSQTTEITIDLEVQGSKIDTIWYGIYNETDGSWLDVNNQTWTTATVKTLGGGGIYTLYAWVNNTAGSIQSANVTFTMFHEISYEGDTIFSESFIVELYQKVTFRKGIFSFSAGDLMVLGHLDMEDVFWDSTVFISANSAIAGTNVTFYTGVLFEGNVIALLENVRIRSFLLMYDNASVSITNVTIECSTQMFGNSNLEIKLGSLSVISVHENSRLNISFSTGSEIEAYDYSSVILSNYSASINYIEQHGNVSVSMINSTINSIRSYVDFASGTFTIDNNELSGTGSYTWPSLTLVNTAYNQYISLLRAFGSTQLFINNSQYWEVYAYDSVNLTVVNSTLLSSTCLYDNSNASLINSICPYVYCITNGTVYFADFNCGILAETLVFYEGNITGYNDTFVGATSWTSPKITFGPSVSYTLLKYSYQVFNQVNLTLRDTYFVDSVASLSTGNISIIRCDISYFESYVNATITLINSTIPSCYVHGGNITLINSTVSNRLVLLNSAFGSILENSYVVLLELHDTSDYRSSDSTIVTVDDQRP